MPSGTIRTRCCRQFQEFRPRVGWCGRKMIFFPNVWIPRRQDWRLQGEGAHHSWSWSCIGWAGLIVSWVIGDDVSHPFHFFLCSGRVALDLSSSWILLKLDWKLLPFSPETNACLIPFLPGVDIKNRYKENRSGRRPSSSPKIKFWKLLLWVISCLQKIFG